MAARAEPATRPELRRNGHDPESAMIDRSLDDSDDDALTPREEAARLRLNEADVLDVVLGVAEGRTEYEIVPVVYKEKRFRFLIQTVDHDVYKKSFREASSFTRDRMSGGQRVHDDTDNALFFGLMIYEATVDNPHAVYRDDAEQVRAHGPLLGRRELWDNEDLQNRLLKGEKDLNRRRRAATMIARKILKPGQAEAVVGVIDRISGYGQDLEDLGKD